MKIGAEHVRQVARLAELAVADGEVETLAAQLQAIVSFVEQLEEVDCDLAAPPVVVGPEQLLLRDDVVAPIPMTRRAAELAPAFEQGFFVVPRVGGMGDE